MSKIQVHIKSFHSGLIEKALIAVQKSIKSLHDFSLRVHTQKTFKKRYTVLKSPHVHKKSREQFEVTEYHTISSIESENAAPFLLLLKSGSFYGVQLKASLKTSSFFFPVCK